MPRAIARTSKGNLIGKGLNAQTHEAISQLVNAMLTGGRGKKLTETQMLELLELMDTLIELQGFHQMLEDGQIDELLDQLGEAGLLPADKFQVYKAMNGTNGN